MQIVKLERKVLKERLNNFIDLIKDVPNEYWGEEHFLTELDRKWELSLMASENKELVGFIIASKKKESVHIHKFMISKLKRSKGYGTILLNEFENICVIGKENFITLKVYKTNLRAINFYEENGFRISKSFDKLFLMIKKIKK